MPQLTELADALGAALMPVFGAQATIEVVHAPRSEQATLAQPLLLIVPVSRETLAISRIHMLVRHTLQIQLHVPLAAVPDSASPEALADSTTAHALFAAVQDYVQAIRTVANTLHVPATEPGQSDWGVGPGHVWRGVITTQWLEVARP